MDRAPKTDEWLMGRVSEGDRDRLEPLVRRHASPLLNFIRHMVHDAHRSEELFQEVFLAVWNKRSSYMTWRTFKPWLYAIALNKVREHLRGRPTSWLIIDGQWPEREVDPSPQAMETLVEVETATIVNAAVAELPVTQRAVVALRIWSGLSYGEIAAILDKSEATIRAHMHQGLANLRTRLEPKLR